MKIVILEFIDEAESLLARYGKEIFPGEDVRVVCLDPKVRAFLKNQGIPSEDTCAYFDTEAQHRVIKKCDEWSETLVRAFHYQDRFGIESGYQECVRFYLRLFINHLLWIVEILDNISKQHDVKMMYFCLPLKFEMMYTPAGMIKEKERFLGLLAQNFCKIKGIEYLTGYADEQKTSDWKAVIVYHLARMVAWLDYFFMVKGCSHADRPVIVPGLSYRMDLLLSEIKKDHTFVKPYMIWEGASGLRKDLYKIYLTITNHLKKWKKQNILHGVIHLDLIKDRFPRETIEQNKIHQAFDKLLTRMVGLTPQYFSYEGISVFAFLRKKIAAGFKEEILELQHSTVVLSKIFERIKPKLLISMYSTGIYYMMGELANRQGFKALNISHGTHVPPNNEYERIENYRLSTSVISNTYPYVAVQTPWTKEFLDYYQDKRERLLTGPLLYSIVNQNDREASRKEIMPDDPTGKIIVYATTQKDRGSQRFHITETLDEYLRSLEDIIGVVNEMKNVHFILRPHPVCDITEEEFRLLLPACPRLRILNQGSFSRILSAADLLISYSSTTIEEAIQNDIPVLLYDKWQRYNHFNVPELTNGSLHEKKPVYYLTRKEHLQNSIYNILFSPKISSISPEGLVKYKYPETYRANFFTFVQDVLETKVKK